VPLTYPKRLGALPTFSLRMMPAAMSVASRWRVGGLAHSFALPTVPPIPFLDVAKKHVAVRMFLFRLYSSSLGVTSCSRADDATDFSAGAAAVSAGR
jgi:hypothetical protein